MSNSPLVDYTRISPNKNSPRNHKIDTITIHCVVGQCTVETLGNIFAPTSRQASSNYGVGTDGKIGMYVEEKDRSWCSSNAANDNRAVTIEVASDTKHPYAVNDRAFAALLDLVTDICKRNGIRKLVWSTKKADRVNHKNGCMLLHSLECSDDAGIAAVKKDISTMEAALKKLSQQEEKYTAELNDALQQYADLKTQSAEFDPDELQDARLDLRPAMERSVVDRVQSAYGDKYDYLMMYDSKRDVADILHEETEARSIREHLRQKQQAQQKQNKKNSRDTWER